MPARVAHQLEHRPVLGEYGRGEVRDALAGCEPAELADQPGADPASVVAVGDLEGDLCLLGAPRESEVLRRSDEEVPVERPDGKVVRVSATKRATSAGASVRMSRK